jgi:methane/ammonia monooxygenase subunit B
MSVRSFRKFRPAILSVVFLGLLSVDASLAQAHGEKAQEPFLRMRSFLYYDVEWSKEKVQVGEELSVTGRFRVFEEWPEVLDDPNNAFINIGIPGPVFVRKSSTLNGVSLVNTTSLEIGRDYEFETVIKGRKPGRYHVHPMVNVESAGPIVGPGKWVEVEGDFADFTNPVTTITGETVDLETHGLGNVVRWHLIWGAIGVAWLVYWFRRPLFIPRMVRIQQGDTKGLITGTDYIVGAAFALVTIVLIAIGYFGANAKYPLTVPLQTGRKVVEPLPLEASPVKIVIQEATYRIPGRTVNLTLEVTNESDRALRIGEFTTANLRFLNPDVVEKDPSYPAELVEDGLVVEPAAPIQPGETQVIKIAATNPAWETEQLAMLIHDPDSRFGGLLMFYDAEGNRSIVSIGGGLIPTFI